MSRTDQELAAEIDAIEDEVVDAATDTEVEPGGGGGTTPTGGPYKPTDDPLVKPMGGPYKPTGDPLVKPLGGPYKPTTDEPVAATQAK